MIRLYDYLTPAQQADVTSGTGAIDCQAAFQEAVDEANGLPIELPAGVIRLDSQVSRIPSSATYGGEYAPGMKLFGPGSGRCKIKSHVASNHVFKLATTSGNVFQRDVVFSGFRINGENASGGSGVYVDRCYNAVFEDCFFEYFDLDGLYVYVAANDSHSSNTMIVDRCRFYGCKRWGFNLDPASGSNDLSFLSLSETHFTLNGLDAHKSISAITAGSPTTVTATGHGLTTGDKIYLFNMGGMTALEFKLATVTVVNGNVFTVPIDSTGQTYSGGAGLLRPRIPPSGAIKWRGQMGHFKDGGLTENKNVGLFLPDGPGGATRTMLTNFTIENNTGFPLLVHEADGLIGKGLDLRNTTSTLKSHAQVLFDASASSISGVQFEGCSIKVASYSSPHRAFEAIAQTNLGEVTISGTRWQDYDYSGQDRFGAGLYGAVKLRLIDDNIVQIAPSALHTQTFTTSNPSYTPKATKYDTYLLVLGSGASGTLTIQTPDKGLLAGPTASGRRLLVSIANSSGGSINLALGGSLEATGAPASIANGTRKVVEWMWDNNVGWVLVRAWASF